MFCAISGVTPEEPVISVKSGLLFEKRLIEKAILERGVCPVTGDPLDSSDLLPLKTNKAVKPRPIQAASIPGLIGMFQYEWDSLMLRDHELEKQLNTVREELSYSLFQSDAAARVIARLVKERDEARELLATAHQKLAAGGQYVSEPGSAAGLSVNGKRDIAAEEEAEREPKRVKQPEGSELSDEIKELFGQCSAELSAQRKKRQISSSLAAPEAVEAYTQLSSHPLHKTTKPGILAIEIHPTKDVVVTGGMDGAAVVFDRSSSQVTATLTGHSKRITSLKFVPQSNVIISGSADKTVRLWGGSEDGSYESLHTFSDHSGEVRAVTVHPTSKYFISLSSDKSWRFYDVERLTCLNKGPVDGTEDTFTAASFHPDGLIMGSGSVDSIVRIWDVKDQKSAAVFEGHQGAISSISFSENGYFMATAASDGVKVWDLRKLRNIRDFAPFDVGVPTNTVEFDFSGSYLAMGGSDFRVFKVGSARTEWPHMRTFPDVSGTGKVTCLKFGPDATYIAVGTADRNLRFFGSPAVAEEAS